jgi:hypothetical protein
VNECETKDGFIDRGLIIIENGLIKLGNGNWIPKYPENLSRMQKVEDYYRKLSGGRELAPTKQANMVQTYFSGHNQGSFSMYDPYHDARVGDLYDTLDDEIRSAKVQQISKLRSANQLLEGPAHPNYYSQIPAGSSSAGPVVGTNLAQIVPQFQQDQLPVEPQPFTFGNVPRVQAAPSNTTVDLNQLIQFMNIMNNASRAGTSVQDQMVVTRGGSKTDPPSESKN